MLTKKREAALEAAFRRRYPLPRKGNPISIICQAVIFTNIPPFFSTPAIAFAGGVGYNV